MLTRSLLGIGLALGALGTATPAAASVPAKWCWTMQSGTVKGTFSTDGSMPGDGTASAGTYTITDFSIYESAFPDIEAGSISDNTYAFGNQPTYQIVWDGTAATGYYRDSGNLTNGVEVLPGPGPTGARILFSTTLEFAATPNGTMIFGASTPPSLSPVPRGGLCNGEPTSSSNGESPPDVLEQYARDIDEVCASTWGPSWAQWPNNHTGGWVCTRTLFYNTSTHSWQVR